MAQEGGRTCVPLEKKPEAEGCCLRVHAGFGQVR
jgi:hypothetical protein